MILHTVNKPEVFSRCARIAKPGDIIVLIEDGIYTPREQLPEAGANIKAVTDDVRARGFAEHLGEAVEQISHRGLVRLSVAAEHICNWF